MPFVWVRASPHKISSPDLGEFVKKLPTIVAETLSVPGTDGELTSRDIEVKVELFRPMDIHTKDLEIIIWANDYPERKKDLDDRRGLITEKLRELLRELIFPEITGFVWVLLQPGSFEEFVA